MKENRKKENRLYKKIIGAAVCTSILILSLSNSTISSQLTEGNYKLDIPDVDTQTVEKNVNFSVVLNIGEKNVNNTIKISNLSIPYEESEDLMVELNRLNDKLLKSKNIDEKTVLMEQALNLLNNYNMIPSSFTIENMSKLVFETVSSSSRTEKNIYNEKQNKEPPKRIQGMPYVGVGPGVFAYVSLFGTVTPYGLWNLSTFHALGSTSTINVKMDKSGIHLETDGALLKPIFDEYLNNGTLWELHGPFWQSLWNFLGEDKHVNYTSIQALAVYMIHCIIGHTISYGVAASVFNLMDVVRVRPVFGSFYFFGAPTIPISLTVYKTYPTPWTTIVDIGIVFSILGQFIVPFWYRDSPIN